MLRVISGSAKGLKLFTLEGMNTRPTTDRVKENLFNIILPYIPGSNVLDLFAGTGSLGIEALSRGANSAVFCDRSEQSADIINRNLQHTKLMDKSQFFLGEAQLILKKLSQLSKKFDIIFLDPPYKKEIVPGILQDLENYGVLDEKVLISVETDIEDQLPQQIGTLCVSRQQIYGKTKLTFYKRI
ncbi:16S rRNA (guanine(966)-N(2))-methyltransferase RsmD [Ruminiclostridium papyrosolvens]|uniref:Methyltransferase n=1 Tax=Ruminiclostridium papyrosolvens C7 TaxID=1330534 RepID=U4R411_9FIRM|nr:16S rRNA (guanine(966)-N(2))-methyltransferase RsmD [Ruminiclostridium papyrosolvens]EPR13239.1 methyltransferase [Ruminiclostridium papyrosolvens C7]